VGRILVRVHDVSGRLVRTPVDSQVGPGKHAVSWDGTSDRGLAVASGVYIHELRVERFAVARRTLLLR
jgi:flagellar hook assembly protein FlgD